MKFLPFAAICCTGFAAAVAQVLVIRELLVLFYGNELSAGLILASWLLWTAAGSGIAARWSSRLPRSPLVLSAGLIVLAASLPATVLWIRASRIIWPIAVGEMVPPGIMLALCLSSTVLFCLASGLLFAAAWTLQSTSPSGGRLGPISIYLGEAAGSALGGLCFYFVLLPRASGLTIALLTALAVLAFAVALPWPRRGLDPWHRILKWSGAGLILLTVSALLFAPGLEKSTRRWLWGPKLIEARDTPYHNLALVEDAGLFTLFANGLWLFSAPDPLTAENAVHLALLQHPDPRSVLLIGGGVGGLINEALKHPGIQRIDYVEPDPEIVRLAEGFLPESVTGPLHDARVHLFQTDAGSFLRTPAHHYDVLILNLGDPMNAEMNRFYTAELFGRARRTLNEGGVFSFAISSAPDIIGPAQARLLQSLYATLRRVFPTVVVYPGDAVRFFASDDAKGLATGPDELIRRISVRGLDLQYVRDYYLLSNLEPMRMKYVASVVEGAPAARVNRDFEPTCYFNHLVLWAAQLHPRIEQALLAVSTVGAGWLWTGLALAALFGLTVGRPGRTGAGAAVALNVAVVGGASMALEIMLLLGFQILEGFVYTQLELIISFFMTGMALGAAGAAWLSRWIVRPIGWLMGVQAAFGFYGAGIVGLMIHLHHRLDTSPQENLHLGLIFSLLALVGGIPGGLHFSLAVRAVSGPAAPSGKIGGGLYALDLLGAAAGAVSVSLFLMPVYGLTTAGLVVAGLVLAGVPALWQKA